MTAQYSNRLERLHQHQMLRRCRACAILLAVASGSAAAIPPSLPDAIPQDTVVAFFVDARPEQPEPTSVASTLGVATFLMDQISRFGLFGSLDAECRGWMDGLASLSLLRDHPHAVALFDVRAGKLKDGGHRLAGVNAALVVHTAGDNAKIEQRIQQLLNTHTNSDESRLATTTSDGRPIFTFRDRRLPDWFVVNWGVVGDYYVVALGEGSFQKIVDVLDERAQSLAADAWFKKAFDKVRGPKAFFAITARFDRIEAAADTDLAKKIARVRKAVQLEDVERGVWSVVFDDRAVRAQGIVRRGGRSDPQSLTTLQIGGVAPERLIPADATAYAMLDVAPQRFLNGLSEAYLASRSLNARESSRRYWRELQREAEVSIERDIVSRLGRGVVIHNAPPHPLRLPLMWTLWLPIQREPETLHAGIDRLFKAWQHQLANDGMLRLRKDADGVWYLFFGINGPALGMTDRWLVISFSPPAVRQSIAFLKTLAAEPLPDPTPEGTNH